MEAETQLPVEEEPAVPFHSRLVDTFLSPGRMAEAVARRPAWAAALFLGALLIGIQTALIPMEVWQGMFRETMLESGRDMPQGFEMGGTVMRISTLIGGLVFWFVWAFLMSGILTLVFAFVLGDEGRYVQYLAALSHAWVIPALVGLFLVPLRISEQNPQLTLNLGTFFFFLPEGYLLKVLTMLDLSQIWAWLVMAQGVHAIDSRRSFGSAAAVLIGLSVVMAMIFAPWARL